MPQQMVREDVEAYIKREKIPRPTIDELEEWANNGVCECPDGCTTEPDGYCEHCFPSWFLHMGLI